MDHDAELDALAAELVAAGLLTVEGDEYTLTPDGAALGRQMVMTGEGDALELLNALLDASARQRVPSPRHDRR